MTGPFWVRVGYDLALPNQLWQGDGRNESCAMPHPCCPVCTGVHILPDLSVKLQSSQNNNITHVFKWDLHVLEFSGDLQFWWPSVFDRLCTTIRGGRFCVPRSVAVSGFPEQRGAT